MKTKEELNALKDEVETVSKKLSELNEEELAQVSGGEIYEPLGYNELGFTPPDNVRFYPLTNENRGPCVLQVLRDGVSDIRIHTSLESAIRWYYLMLESDKFSLI